MKKQTVTANRERLGCYIDESAGSSDDCNLRTIEFAEAYGFEHEPLPEADREEDADDYSQTLSGVAEDAVNFLNDHNETPFAFWTFEDNSLFLVANVEGAKEDCEFMSDADNDEPPAGFRGYWLSISDHGNATLYDRSERADADGNGKENDREIWGVV